MRTATLNGKVRFDIRKQLEREEAIRKTNKNASDRITIREAQRKAGWILTAVFGLLLGLQGTIYAQWTPSPAYSDKDAIRAVIGEAGNQGYAGMLAVACGIRNRGTL